MILASLVFQAKEKVESIIPLYCLFALVSDSSTLWYDKRKRGEMK